MYTSKLYHKRNHDMHLVKRGLQYCRFWFQSRVIMQKTDSWKEQTGRMNRLPSRDIEHVLLIEDTSELNLERHRGRITDRSGLGHSCKINAPSGESLKSRIQSQACVGEYALEVKGDNHRRRKRKTQMELRDYKISLCRPAKSL